MVSFKSYSRIVQLLVKALMGNLTGDEEQELRQWKNAGEKNRRLYEKLSDETFWEKKAGWMRDVDVVEAWRKMDSRRSRRLRMRKVRRLAVAAAVVLMPLAAVLLFMPEKGKRNEIPVAEVIKPGEVKAELILADGSEVVLGNAQKNVILEQEGVCIYADKEGIAYTGENVSREVQYNTLKVPRGGEYTVTLGDGTIVYLNSESEIRYPLQFTEQERRIVFSGEAYFEVKHDEQRPFIIESNGTAVEVLGTSFNVRSYPDEKQVETTLVTGKVRFSAQGGSVVLEPGEQGIANRAMRVSKKPVDVQLYIAWKEGKFVFRQQRLEEVMNNLSRWYDVEVFFAVPSQKEVLFTGNVRRYEDFGKIIEMLEMTGDTKFKVEGKTIVISK